MLTFTPDGRHVVVANEGEPSADGQQDGEGSVSVVGGPSRVQEGLSGVQVRNADFRAWDNRPLPAGVRQVERQKRASQDFEPEGIAISGDSRKAYVTLQENDAVAVVDLASAHVERIIGLGYKDHNATGNELDVSGLGHADRIQTLSRYWACTSRTTSPGTVPAAKSIWCWPTKEMPAATKRSKKKWH